MSYTDLQTFRLHADAKKANQVQGYRNTPRQIMAGSSDALKYGIRDIDQYFGIESIFVTPVSTSINHSREDK